MTSWFFNNLYSFLLKKTNIFYYVLSNTIDRSIFCLFYEVGTFGLSPWMNENSLLNIYHTKQSMHFTTQIRLNSWYWCSDYRLYFDAKRQFFVLLHYNVYVENEVEVCIWMILMYRGVTFYNLMLYTED